MREDIYIQEIFYGISLPEKEEILKKSKDFVFMTNIKTTSIKDVFTGYVVKTKNGSNFKINDKAFFHRLKAGSAKFNCSIVYTSYKDCYSSLDDFEDTKEDKVFTFIPLLHLDHQRKIDLLQKKHLGDIEIKMLQSS